MKQLPIYRSLEVALIDDEDFYRCSLFRWYLVGDDRQFWAVKAYINSKEINLANFVKGTNQRYDHKDRNFLNSQKDNLRECTQLQNTWNKGKTMSDTHSQYKGVSCTYAGKPWRAYITVNKKRKHLGSFNTEVEAARAYNFAATKHFGEFAAINKLTD